jgi:hypothetical protein
MATPLFDTHSTPTACVGTLPTPLTLGSSHQYLAQRQLKKHLTSPRKAPAVSLRLNSRNTDAAKCTILPTECARPCQGGSPIGEVHESG